MQTALLRIAAIMFVALTGAQSVVAKPLHTTLADAVAKAPTIVVGVFRGAVEVDGVEPYRAAAFHFDVERVVRGTSVPVGPVTLLRGQGFADITRGARVVVLLTPSAACASAEAAERGGSETGNACTFTLEFVGVPLVDGLAIEENVLLMRGFYDFNAHLVSPGLVSLHQLRQVASGRGTLDYRVRGRLHGLSEDGTKLVAFGPDIDVRGTYEGHQINDTRVEGLSPPNFPSPKLHVTSGFGRHLSLQFNRGWPRPLVVEAEVTGVEASGALRARFIVAMPDVLTVGDIQAYLSDPSASYPRFSYAVTLATGEVWTFSDGDPTAPATLLKRPGLPSLPQQSLSLAPERALRFKGLTMTLAPLVGTNLLPGGASRQFRQELLRGPVACVISSGRRRGTGCTIRLTHHGVQPARR